MRMVDKDCLVYIDSMLESIELIRKYVAGMAKGEFKDSE